MEKILRQIIERTLLDMGLSDTVVEIEVPRDESLGDLSTPVAMKLAKRLRKNPKSIAEDIKCRIEEIAGGIFERIEIAGQGFINFTFSRDALSAELRKLHEMGGGYFIEDVGKGKRVQIEFVSANPTGPLHLGHGRGAAVGIALANMMKEAGYDVQREYYINDAGRQIKLLGHSVYARYRHKRLGEGSYPFPDDGYKGDYILELADSEELNSIMREYNLYEDSFEDISEALNDISCSLMLRDIRRDLSDFGVTFDNWQSEKELYLKGYVNRALEHLAAKGLIYEHEGAQWFRSTAFGDDKDRVVLKQDGEYTYFASDIAYHKLKLDKGFDEIIDLWGADHHGYIPRVSAVLQGLGLPAENFKVLLIQMVTLLRDGKPVQMSKRAGEFITLREVMDEIGADTTKFLFLTRRHDTALDIDIDKAKAESADNPVYYVQYAHARINSILERAAANGINIDECVSTFNGLDLNEDELRLLKKVLLYPMAFRSAVIAREPHRIAFFLQETAALFHPYYHKHRVITEDLQGTSSRLSLCIAVKALIRSGLTTLGVSVPEKM